MKWLKIFNSVINVVPKLDPMVETVVKTAKARKVIKSIIRVLQITAAVYLLYKGLIDSEDAVDIIKGK
tara:strand:- start:3999 stop:4202 length:204 start_codon:yes stop_codon:yes gene_type:complete